VKAGKGALHKTNWAMGNGYLAAERDGHPVGHHVYIYASQYDKFRWEAIPDPSRPPSWIYNRRVFGWANGQRVSQGHWELISQKPGFEWPYA